MPSLRLSLKLSNSGDSFDSVASAPTASTEENVPRLKISLKQSNRDVAEDLDTSQTFSAHSAASQPSTGRRGASASAGRPPTKKLKIKPVKLILNSDAPSATVPQITTTAENDDGAASTVGNVQPFDRPATESTPVPFKKQSFDAGVWTADADAQHVVNIENSPSAGVGRAASTEEIRILAANSVAALPKRRKPVYFYGLLAKLLEAIKIKDAYGMFWEPVDTTAVADYLDVIKTPMDICTMEKKIFTKKYAVLADFEADFKLMISNAKTYNAPETIYYRTAEKVGSFGTRLLLKEASKIFEGDYELFFDEAHMPTPAPKASSKAAREKEAAAVERKLHSLRVRDASKVSYNEDFTLIDEYLKDLEADSPPPSAATNDAMATNGASTPVRKAVALFKRSPDGSIVFSSISNATPAFFADGSVALEDEELRQLCVAELLTDHRHANIDYTLAKAMGGPLYEPRISEAEYVTLAAPLNYGPYVNSFAPTHDSTKSTLTVSESMLYSLIYGDAIGKAFTDSMKQFAAETGSDFLVGHVHGLVHSLTRGTSAVTSIAQKDYAADSTVAALKLEDALVTQDERVFAHFADATDTHLYKISRLLLALCKAQNERIFNAVSCTSSQNTPNTFCVSPVELEAAQKVKRYLCEAVAAAHPSSILSQNALQKMFDEWQRTISESSVPSFRGTL